MFLHEILKKELWIYNHISIQQFFENAKPNEILMNSKVHNNT